MLRALKYVSPTAMKPMINAITCTAWLSKFHSSASAAPNDAPADAPKISGDTIGFLNRP